MGLKAISLFTGAGGLDYGFEAAGFTTTVAVELDAASCETLRRNRPDWPVIEGDATKLATADLLRVSRLKPGKADVLIGGPPCQPFSKSAYWASGDSRRLSDPRASTLAAYLRVLAETRPRAFLLENVEGLGFSGKDEGLRLVTATLDSINREHGTAYTAAVKVLNAADYGVPQLRRRMFIVGARDGRPFHFPEPTHVDPATAAPDDARPRHMTAWDALHDAPALPNEDLRIKGRWADMLPSIPEGRNYLWHTSRGGGLPLFGWRRRFWNFLLKVAKERPAWTIQAQPGPATGPFHWESRRFSAAELARLQTFPRDITFPDALAVAHKQLGNAVPSLLAEVLARAIRTQLLGKGEAGSPALAVEPAPMPPPRAKPPAPVPAKYRHLLGQHAAHPGTGLGPSALQRGDNSATIL